MARTVAAPARLPPASTPPRVSSTPLGAFACLLPDVMLPPPPVSSTVPTFSPTLEAAIRARAVERVGEGMTDDDALAYREVLYAVALALDRIGTPPPPPPQPRARCQLRPKVHRVRRPPGPEPQRADRLGARGVRPARDR